VTTDPYGRVMYGTISSDGTANAVPRSLFSEVIDLRNVAGILYQLSTRPETQCYWRTRPVVRTACRDVESLLRVNTTGTGAGDRPRQVGAR
jgi:hypothetical protein